jgi:hypothetical protein
MKAGCEEQKQPDKDEQRSGKGESATLFDSLSVSTSPARRSHLPLHPSRSSTHR